MELVVHRAKNCNSLFKEPGVKFLFSTLHPTLPAGVLPLSTPPILAQNTSQSLNLYNPTVLHAKVYKRSWHKIPRNLLTCNQPAYCTVGSLQCISHASWNLASTCCQAKVHDKKHLAIFLLAATTNSLCTCKNTWQPFRLHHQPITMVLKTPSDTHQLSLHKHVEVLKHALVIVYKIKILGTKYVHLYLLAHPTHEHILHMHIA